jgi:cytochrome c oxidase cbb3-type subunit 2
VKALSSVAAIAVGLAAALAAASSPADPLEDPDPAERAVLEAEGRRLYRIACRACHGTDGDGNGPMADALDPRPRDFRLGEYKIRSARSGEAATGRDLFDVITRGMPGTRMPAWPWLTERERWSLVHYVRTFDEFARQEPPSTRLDAGAPVVVSDESVAEGRKVYDELKCAQCHGETGRGDGPSAAELVDSHGAPSRTTDLLRGWTYKGGTSPEDILMRFMSGMDGTPMPSYADAFVPVGSVAEIGRRIEDGEDVTAEERETWDRAVAEARAPLWHLANYMASLAEDEGRLRDWFLGDTEVAK